MLAVTRSSPELVRRRAFLRFDGPFCPELVRRSGPRAAFLRSAPRNRKDERSISIDDQRRDVVAWATANDVPLADEVIEVNISGSKPWRERELGQAIDRKSVV